MKLLWTANNRVYIPTLAETNAILAALKQYQPPKPYKSCAQEMADRASKLD